MFIWRKDWLEITQKRTTSDDAKKKVKGSKKTAGRKVFIHYILEQHVKDEAHFSRSAVLTFPEGIQWSLGAHYQVPKITLETLTSSIYQPW